VDRRVICQLAFSVHTGLHILAFVKSVLNSGNSVAFAASPDCQLWVCCLSQYNSQTKEMTGFRNHTRQRQDTAKARDK
jgi:hypothetical protein